MWLGYVFESVIRVCIWENGYGSLFKSVMWLKYVHAAAAYAGRVGGSDPPTAAKAQPYHHLPNITNQYRPVSHYNCEQELMWY